MASNAAPPGPVGAAAGSTPTAPRHMRASLRIGRIAGIDIRVHVTFALLAVLVLANARVPGAPSVLAQIVWIVVVFASVTAHELAHSLVARRFGIEVAEIDLLPIGGVSRLRSLPRAPRQQLEVAIAGPVASVVLGLVCAALAVAAGSSAWPPSVVDGPLVARVAWVNLLLAGFNLVPAFPLDGGRVLRALLAERGDEDVATMVAARVGRFLAGVLVVAGLMVNVWLLAIGVFVWLGSSAEEWAAVVHAAIAGLRVRDVMRGSIAPDVAAGAAGLGEPVDADALVADTDLLASPAAVRPAVRAGVVVGYVSPDDVRTRADHLVERWRREHALGA